MATKRGKKTRSLSEWIYKNFPHLKNSDHCVLETRTDYLDRYNCFSFVVGVDDKAWWPHPTEAEFHWPSYSPREETVERAIEVLERSFHYDSCGNGVFQKGTEKIAIFASDRLEHVAFQRADTGDWYSKIGRQPLVRHPLFALENGDYGNIVAFVARRFSPKRPHWVYGLR